MANQEGSESGIWYAHSRNAGGIRNSVRQHLQDVGCKAQEFGAALGFGAEAHFAGILHDLGKYGSLFEKRLQGQAKGIDHWSMGAYEALRHAKLDGIATALAIQGHHIGLQRADHSSLKQLGPKSLEAGHPLGLRLSEAKPEVLLERWRKDGFSLPSLFQSIYSSQEKHRTAAMLDVRMLFSTLVDADYLATEAHFECQPDGAKRWREAGPPLQPERALGLLNRRLRQLSQSGSSSDQIRKLRADLLQACRKGGEGPFSTYTLTAPTGAGKTLSMLAFALEQAVRRRLRRIVFVIPYLTIIEQTARVLRELFADEMGQEYVLEHHSLAGDGDASDRAETDDESTRDDQRISRQRRQRLLSENWDAPIIVTTSVQLLQSLFANRPADCRKLHRLGGSVVLFDEVQTLPQKIAVPTLAALSHLSDRYGSSVVFSTATQPAFDQLHELVREGAPRGWRPSEVVSPELKLFERSRRVRVEWPQDRDDRLSWEEVAREIAQRPQCLCIVNLKRHATHLAGLLQQMGIEGLLHLSTNMCPRHREAVLTRVRRSLEDPESPCRLVSTQCVEAGVDVDFPAVLRALGPLDAIAQAAGRCNRNGRLDAGLVRVFIPELQGARDGYPDGSYRQAAQVALALLSQSDGEGLDICDPDLFRRYWNELYALRDLEAEGQELRDSIQVGDFPDVAAQYRVIEQDAINVIVPYAREEVTALEEDLEERGRLTRDWIRRARPHAISLNRTAAARRPDLQPCRLGPGGDRSESWFWLLSQQAYDNDLLGLREMEEVWIS